MLVEFSHSTELTAKKGGCKNLKDSRPRRKIKDSKRSMPLHFIPWCVVLLKFKKGKIWPCCIVWTHFLHITIQNRINRWDSRVDPPTVLASSKQRSAPEDFDSCDGVGRILGSTRIYRGKNLHQGDLFGFFFHCGLRRRRYRPPKNLASAKDNSERLDKVFYLCIG